MTGGLLGRDALGTLSTAESDSQLTVSTIGLRSTTVGLYAYEDVNLGPSLFGALISLAALFGFVASSLVWVDREAFVMGSRLRVEIEAPTEADADRIIDRVFDTAVSLDRKWTTWDAGSELAGVRAAEIGVPVRLSTDTFEMLSHAWQLADRTDGAFDPAVGPLVDVWSTPGAGQRPPASELEHAMASVGRRCFDLSPASGTVTRHCPDAWIDGGGFGKGAALAAIIQILDEEGVESARIDFGGQLLLRGLPGGEPPTVTIADPRDPGRAAFEWAASAGSFATTSQTVPGLSGPGGERGRVLDPRTGLSVESWGSVTVRSDDPLEADALATALFVMGPREGIRWLAARPTVDAVLLLVGPGGVLACGREHILQALRPVKRDASISTSPLLAVDLRSCPA